MDNVYKVNERQWKKWGEKGQKVFIEVFERMRDNQDLFLHPVVNLLPEKQWETTAWNAAWIAADAGKE